MISTTTTNIKYIPMNLIIIHFYFNDFRNRNSSMNKSLLLYHHYICWIATLIIISYCIYIFSLNKDLCTIDYTPYNEEENDMFPVVSFCLKNPICEDKLKTYNSTYNVSSYIDFLDGNWYDPGMIKIDYESVLKNLSDYIEPFWTDYKNGSFLNLHTDNNNV